MHAQRGDVSTRDVCDGANPKGCTGLAYKITLPVLRENERLIIKI